MRTPYKLVSGFWLALALVLAACGGSPAPTPTQQLFVETEPGVLVIDPSLKVTDFKLTNQDGKDAYLHDLTANGKKFVLFSFGYTNCPDVCPVTLANFKLVKMNLGDQADNVQIVFIGVDTRRDVPARLKEYLVLFDNSFVGLTGEQDALKAVAADYRAVWNINDAGGLRDKYTVDHTASAFLIDPNGGWARKYNYGTAPDVIAADIKEAIKAFAAPQG